MTRSVPDPIVGDATAVSDMRVDMATMTGNMAQVFLTDDARDRPGREHVFIARRR